MSPQVDGGGDDAQSHDGRKDDQQPAVELLPHGLAKGIADEGQAHGPEQRPGDVEDGEAQ